jgi:hypothetical protein
MRTTDGKRSTPEWPHNRNGSSALVWGRVTQATPTFPWAASHGDTVGRPLTGSVMVVETELGAT